MKSERVSENLNRALHALLAADLDVVCLGEDIQDPYGGAFKVTSGLSEVFPDRVLATPISEGGFVGFAAGIALAGGKSVVEVMFGDFLAYAFDPLWNFAAKSVSMYGRRVPMRMVVRVASGGNRGYGPTHSQSPQKHFIGIPDLEMCEASPFQDHVPLLAQLINRGRPVLLFEHKTVYGERVQEAGRLDDLFLLEHLGDDRTLARVHGEDFHEESVALIVSGGVASRAVQAARRLFLEDEIECQVFVPFQLYPFDPAPMLPLLQRASQIFVAEEGVEGGAWAGEVALTIGDALWGRLKCPVRRIHSRFSVIPAARHLEEQVVLQTEHICEAIRREVLHA